MADRPPIAERCAAAFQERYGRQPEMMSWAPGRINLLGGHTDYNGGLALPAAINRWVCVALSPRQDDQVTIRSIDFNSEYTGQVSALPTPSSSWQRFVVGILDIFSLTEALPSGFDAVFTGDVPDGAGLSSSAALTVSWMAGLRAWSGAEIADIELAKMAQSVEHTYLNVQCGLLDQVASLMGQRDHVMRVDFKDLTVEQVPAQLQDVEWVVLHSGVRRELASSGYWLRVQECASGLEAIRQEHPEVSHFRDIQLDWLGDTHAYEHRLRHVLTENARVDAAVELVTRGDSEALGRLLFEAHQSLRDDYQVSCTELDGLVDIASEDLQCLGARMVGGGFGGCTLNVVRAGEAQGFMDRVMGTYRQRFDPSPRGYCFELVGGAGLG